MTAVAAAPRRATHAPAFRLSFAHLLKSEFVKILTLHSTWWSLGVTAALSIGISLLIAAASRDFGGSFPAANVIVSPTQFTMLVAGILGAIVITGEYSTGMIRSTLTAEPRRGAVLLAKAVVVALVMAATTVVIYAVAIAVTAPLLTSGFDWSDPAQSLVPLVLGVVSMAAFTLIGLGFGFLIRSGAGAIAATVGVLFVLPIVFSLFSFGGPSWQWLVDGAKYLPVNAAALLTAPGGDELATGGITLAAWALAPLVLGWVALRARDA
ncbi:ABC transporter permease subunit [Microbacterium trichothecenolyticum]|uniref:ABC-2 type transport system permease protein n=1 Tax=Microbacterium trichothecenolyticum TaxID=69370 RepID=A0ABU0TQQ5_MICTR|nr:ABC transporter permease subunit [Microbacterium trichothecenolyticum]MDQ1122002.1 ABC-2 type transport system permease protein [Microbacterium trichothecenolyticum]